MHLIRMASQATNSDFHAKARGLLGPYAVANEGVMQKGADGAGVSIELGERCTAHGK